jgi:hypothetical protein
MQALFRLCCGDGEENFKFGTFVTVRYSNAAVDS